jgi:hypothetical protein
MVAKVEIYTSSVIKTGTPFSISHFSNTSMPVTEATAWERTVMEKMVRT